MFVYFELVMPYNCPSKLDKRRIIDAFIEGRDFLEVSDILNVNRKTAYGIVSRYRNRGHEDLDRGGPMRKKWDDEVLAAAILIVEENPLINLKDLNIQIR